MNKRLTATLFSGLILALMVPSVWAAEPAPNAVADFYRGRSVQVIVGHAPGGGFDTYTRTIARHLGKHIPGRPTIIVLNMPGAGGMVAGAYMYNRAPKDGTAIGNVIGGIVRAQLLGLSGVQFDARKFHYLGAPNSENSLLMVTGASGFTSFEQLMEPGGRVANLGDGGVATTNHTASLLTRDVLGANIKVVTGYGGTAKVELSMEQGELDGYYNDWASSKTRVLAKFESGDWLILGQLTEKPLKDLPQKNVPLIQSYAKTEEQRHLLRFGIIVPNRFTRPYFLPPGVPADRVAALKTAFAKTMTDERFLAEAKKIRLDVNPIGAVELEKLINDYLAMPAPLKEKLRKLLGQN